MKKPKPQPRWRVTLVRKKGQPIGTVAAATAQEAVKVAIAQYNITEPEQQRRLIAQPIDR
jgi:hypothetical protein